MVKTKKKLIPCDCPKGGMYETSDGGTVTCRKCDGFEWKSKHTSGRERGKMIVMIQSHSVPGGAYDIDGLIDDIDNLLQKQDAKWRKRIEGMRKKLWDNSEKATDGDDVWILLTESDLDEFQSQLLTKEEE